MVKDSFGIPRNNVNLKISSALAFPVTGAVVQIYDGNKPVNSPMNATTDDNGSYTLWVDFSTGGNLEYSGEILIMSSVVGRSVLFDIAPY